MRKGQGGGGGFSYEDTVRRNMYRVHDAIIDYSLPFLGQ